MTDQYAVIGNPIEHSLSPAIHAAFAKQTGEDIRYEKVEAPLDGFAETVHQLIDRGYRGVNVTVPFKFEAFYLANHVAQTSTDAGAANTLLFNKDGIVAHNTDGIGLIADVEQNLQSPLRGQRVLLLGAGGAAQGVAVNIATAQPDLFVVANRSLDKVHTMQQKVAQIDATAVTAITAAAFDQLSSQTFDVVINATSTGLSNTALPIPDSIFAKGCLAYDMVYGKETPFMAQARAANAQVADGLGMLVEQAAEAFSIWRGVRPDTIPVMQAMRAL